MPGVLLWPGWCWTPLPTYTTDVTRSAPIDFATLSSAALLLSCAWAASGQRSRRSEATTATVVRMLVSFWTVLTDVRRDASIRARSGTLRARRIVEHTSTVTDRQGSRA